MPKILRPLLICSLIFFLISPGIVKSEAAGLVQRAAEDGEAPNRTLRELFKIVESETGYRMLYRDALVAGKHTRYQPNSQWETTFPEMIRSLGLDARIDHTRNQIVIFRRATDATESPGSPADGNRPDTLVRRIKLEGYVMDDNSGERLPFATVIWEQKACAATATPAAPGQSRQFQRNQGVHHQPLSSVTGFRSGTKNNVLSGYEPAFIPDETHRTELQATQTDLQGWFEAEVHTCSDVKFRLSYVGYASRNVTIAAGDLQELTEIPFRLSPIYYEGKEIVITGPVFHNPADSVYQSLLSIGKFSPAGESNTIRMLQTLPSVSHGTALSEGLYIRGSRPDAHQVLLDGSVIYNQSHLFGLVDSFNAEAIRTSNFYYDVTPARYQGPPGGTLNLVTRTGSLHEHRGRFGLSSSAVSAGLEGPLVKEQASWLLSGRASVLNMTDWLGTDRMIAWGLDIDRANSLDDRNASYENRIITPGDYQVRFHDLHTKLFWESSSQSRWSIGGYSGYNHTRQHADRLVMSASRGSGRHDLEEETFETVNNWGNHSINIGNFRSLSENISLQARAGFSHYQSRFKKEDFTYQRPVNTQTQLLRVHPFEHESLLTHWHATMDFRYHSLPPQWMQSVRFGTAVHGYHSDYEEHSLNRARYSLQSDPMLYETYVEGQFRLGKSAEDESGSLYRRHIANLEAGSRIQYLSDGGFLQASPRIRITVFPNAPVSGGLGYSRTYQYVYKLSFYNLTTSDIWITASEGQKPTSSDHWSAGIYLRPGVRTNFQAEAFLKRQQNLRFHEINIQSVQAPVTEAPWFHEMEGMARGLELLFRHRRGPVTFTQTYTLSSTDLRQELLNEGNWFNAYWDRRHQFNTMTTLQIMPGFLLHMNWLYATGAPDRLNLHQVDESRLGFYSRVDLSLRYSIPDGKHNWVLQTGIYNALNRQNPWYNDWVLTLDDTERRNRLTPVQADVYDLGLQLSFSVRYYFDP